MKIKTTNLTGRALDWAVAKCEGMSEDMLNDFEDDAWLYTNRRYSTDWSQGGPIIEREWICADRLLSGQWLAAKRTDAGDSMLHAQSDPTPLIAAMRCYVASTLGDEVEVPDELCKGDTP